MNWFIRVALILLILVRISDDPVIFGEPPPPPLEALSAVVCDAVTLRTPRVG